MGGLTFDYSKTFIESHEMAYYKESVKLFHEQLHHKTGVGSDFLGWVEQPVNFDKAEFSLILDAAKSIKEKAQVLLVIGIGGSYIGARAAIEMLGHSFHNQLPDGERKAPAVYFVGNSLSGTYYRQLMGIVKDKEVCVCVISKSGTTIEPAIAFRMIKTFMEDRYGKQEAAKRIYAVTDAARGALKSLAVAEGYESFVIADDIGGRYSVLSPVGLLPIAAAGIDVELVMQGARDAYEEYMEPELDRNPCYQYAAARNILNRKGKAIEVMVSYEPALQYFSEWWKQLFGESEGKDGKGIFPASVSFSTDLHSLGQFLQDGTRNLFETILNISEPKEDFVIPEDKENLDGLNFISGRYMSDVNKQAYLGTMLAHQDGGVPISVIDIPKADAYNFGKLVYFFEKACAMSGYLSGVNPFDQPGVEAYKSNMFALLGKQGYKELGEELNKKLK